MATKKSTTTARREPAAPKSEKDVAALLAELSAQVAALTERLARLEAGAPAVPPPAPAPAPEAAKVAPAAPRPPELSEEQLLAVSAALAAFLGVRLRIRSIRLLSSQAWAQVGRVSIQASHRLHN